LGILEQEIQLDIDWRTDPNGKPEKPPGHPSPFNSPAYVEQARKAWANYWHSKKDLDSKKCFLPVRENHKFSGIPLHFSGTDIKEVRHHIMDCKPIQEYLSLPDDNVVYFCTTKVFPLANSIASVWCWIGVHIPMTPDEIFEAQNEKEKRKGDDEREEEKKNKPKPKAEPR